MLGVIAISSIPIFCLGVIAYYSIKEALRPKVEIIENFDFIKNMSQIKFYKSKDNDTNDIGVDFTYNLPVSLLKAKEMIGKNEINEEKLSPCEKLFFKKIKNRKQDLKTAIENFKSFCNSSEKKYPICLKFPDYRTNNQGEIFYYIRLNENEDSGYIFTTTHIKYSVSEEGEISVSKYYKEEEKKQENRTTVKKKIPQNNLRNRNIYNDEGKEIDNSKLFAEDVNCFQEIVDLSKEGASFVIPDEDTKEILEICKEQEGEDLYQSLNNKYEEMEKQKKANSEHQEGKKNQNIKNKQEKPLENSCPFFYCCFEKTDAEKNTEIINLK